MQTAYCFTDVLRKEPATNNLAGLRITPRDLEILEFVLEMKFTGLNEIYEKFFKNIQSGEISKSDWWARERVTKLLTAGFLEKVKFLSVKVFYLLSEKGYYFLKNSVPSKTFCRPVTSIDCRTLDHDMRIQGLRIHLEKTRGITKWQSERALTEIPEVRRYLGKEFRPDAIFENPNGEKVAFELELSRKSHERYNDKVKRYVDIMQSSDASKRIFKRTLVICNDKTIADLWISKTNLYRELFSVDKIDQVFAESGGAQ